jgi:hypothetical protein
MDKSKGYCFIVRRDERHYLLRGYEDQGSMVPREISLEEKRVYAPTPMIHESFFSILVAVAPTVQDTMVTASVVSSPVVTTNENEEPILQEPIETVIAHKKEMQ